MRWVRSSKSIFATAEEHSLRVALLGALLTSAPYALFDGVIVMPISRMMLVLIIGWMLGMSPASPTRSRSTPHKNRALISILLLAITLYGLLRPLVPTLFCLEQLENDFVQAHPKARNLNPRLWQQGYLSGYLQASSCRLDNATSP
ncbi:MAG: hypothetical protein RBT36_08885 [Desulfobulbus sp.]|nr:hypothetical protein [Desulfobulbus sp.]